MIFEVLLSAALAREVPSGVYAMPRDRWDNGQLACAAAAPDDITHGFAHRKLPCGARALICQRRCVIAVRVDAGPFGVETAQGYRVRRRGLRRGEHYRGEVDLRPATAAAIGWRGGPVWFRPL